MNIYDSNMNTMEKNIYKKIGLVLVWLLFAGQVSLSAQDLLASDSANIFTENSQLIDISYGKQTKPGLTSSVSTIYSDKLLKNSVTNVGNALSGRLPGLTVIQQSGEPGADLANLLIRGKNTYNVNSPLILVDGFESDFQQLALFEIESISILKDAAALAMYGQKGANGAILVTTKRGEEGKTRITFNLYGAVQQPQRMPRLLNSYDYATLYNEALLNDGLPVLYSQADLDHYKTGDQPFIYPNNNFFDQLIKSTSPLIQGDLGFRGGNQNLKYFVSMNFMKNDGLYNFTGKNEGYKTQASLDQYNLRANLDINITKKLTAKVDIGGRLDDSRNPGGGSAADIWNAMYNTPPLAYPMLNPNGTIGGNQQYTNNPYGMVAGSGYQNYSERNLNASVRLNYKLDDIVKGLSAGVNGAVSNWMQAIDNKTRTFAVYALQENAETYSYTKIGENSELNWVTGSGHNNRNSFEANLNYETTKGDHALSAMLLYHMDGYIMRGTDLNQRNQGVSGRVHYGYKNRYFAELISGYYGSEVFKEGKRFGLFPAAALGWIASDEHFIKNSLPFVNYLKLRGSYGLTGSNSSFTGISVANRTFYNQYYSSVAGYAFGPTAGTTKAGRQEGRLANPNLTWDKDYKTDISTEMTLFNHINFMFTWFNELRTDILTLDTTIPETLGFSNGRQPWENSGEVKNHGYETTFEYFGSAGDFKYSLEAGVWFNKSEIIKEPDLTIYPDSYRNATGKPIGQIFGLEAIGYYKDDADVANHPKQMFGIVGPGDVIYKDLNHDNVIDDNDKKPIGYSSVPEYTYSLNLNLTYRNFDFTAFFQGVANCSVMPGSYFIPFSTRGNAFDYAFDRWTPNIQSSAYPRLSTVANANNNQSSTIWLRSSDYLKLRNLELGYKLPVKLSKNLKINNIRFFVRGMNLVTFSKEIDFIDPESMTGYPSMKSVSLGVNVTL